MTRVNKQFFKSTNPVIYHHLVKKYHPNISRKQQYIKNNSRKQRCIKNNSRKQQYNKNRSKETTTCPKQQ